MKPNLFRFAPGELSQDAFLAWLLSWADPSAAHINPPLHRTGTHFLDQLFATAGVAKPESYASVKVRAQNDRIDVLVEVNDDYVVLIEDKTETDHHSDQLRRYLDLVTQKYSREKIAAIFLKTGDQCDYKSVEAAGFHRFSRQDLLQVLQQGISWKVTSDIYHDYVDCLMKKDAAVAAFRTTVPAQWEWKTQGVGFFVELQNHILDANAGWGFQANKSGGFMGFWWHFLRANHLDGQLRHEAFLLLEQERLCFKIVIPDSAQQYTAWDAWHQAVMNAPRPEQLVVQRPTRRGTGKHMTFAIAPKYLQIDANGLVDLSATVAVLKQAEQLLSYVFQSLELAPQESTG